MDLQKWVIQARGPKAVGTLQSHDGGITGRKELPIPLVTWDLLCQNGLHGGTAEPQRTRKKTRQCEGTDLAGSSHFRN